MALPGTFSSVGFISTYTPPGVDAFTVLMLHMDGGNGSTSFTDSSLTTPHTITAGGAATQSTTKTKFGVSSALFNGASGFISTPWNSDFDFGTGDFTIDFWVYFSALTNAPTYNLNGCYFAFNPGSNTVYLQNQSASVIFNDVAAGGGWSTDVWYHIALVRNGNNWNFYVNGVSKASATSSVSFGEASNQGNPLYVGATVTNFDVVNGYIDEYRISKGIARWTANFTPPTAPYTT